MSAGDALLEGAKKATEASLDQAHMYIGANDYWYEQARQPATFQALTEKLTRLSDDSFAQLREAAAAYSPSNVLKAFQDQLDVVRNRREEFADRGEAIAEDWRKSVFMQDASAFINAVRDVKTPTELFDCLRSWFEDFKPVEPHTARVADDISAE